MGWNYNIGVEVRVTEEQQYENAVLFYWFFKSRGYTDASICGMLGNIERESPTINPGNMQGTGMGTGNARGLIQWDPPTIIINWTAQHGWEWYDGNAQCEKIAEELEQPTGDWIPTSEYPISGQEFAQLTDVDYAVMAYLKNRERAGVEAVDERLYWGRYWYEEFTGHPPEPPTPPTPPTPTRRKMPVYFYLRRRII